MWHCTEQYRHFETKCRLPTQFVGRRINTSHSVLIPLFCSRIIMYSLSFYTDLTQSGFLGNSEKKNILEIITKMKLLPWTSIITLIDPKKERNGRYIIYLYKLYLYRSRDSVVGIATRYGLEGPGIESRWGEIFHTYQTGSGVHPASCTMGTGSFPGVKAAGAWCWPHTPF
jgi:hypothetical protein